MSQTFRALRNPVYRVFLLTIFISNIGSAVQEVAQGWIVLALTGSTVWLGVVAACVRAPFIVLAPIGGVFADRYNRRVLLGFAQLVQLVPAVALAILGPMGLARPWHFLVAAVLLAILGPMGLARPWHFLVAAVLLGIGNALAFPTTAALQRDLVDKEDLRSAIAIQVGQFQLARALGPLIASGVFAGVGVMYAFHINAASYVPLMIFCFQAWRASRVVPKQGAPSVVAQLREGVAYASKDAGVALLLIGCAVVGALLMTYPALFPMIAKQLGEGASGNAYLGGALGLGAFAGAMLMPMIVAKRNWVVVLAGLTLLASVAQLGLGWAPNIWVACAFAAIASLATAAFMTVTASTIQLLAAREFTGRVMSLNFVAFNTGLVAGSLCLGGLAKGATDLFAPLAILAGIGAVFAVVLFTRASIGVSRAVK